MAGDCRLWAAVFFGWRKGKFLCELFLSFDVDFCIVNQEVRLPKARKQIQKALRMVEQVE
ncbi:hypothetical protein BAG01nite_22080 [Brevibacillus agri]|uniref:Uncharacterized protein n=1 Tax=Brevibacillus agri TaxID=51101 RepID=A0A3M8AVC8_9BACL|nr:hypothetical protein [Brevibacillus agri]QAV13376.1 hypothetical protein BA6348_11845 [Brevibacillus agri]RNB55151.1 hypothetical protein EB820_12055 [Brevibacillus agri]GED26106.1 hypothetical protein BAG01nite_22080 [Brevibacillus agri]